MSMQFILIAVVIIFTLNGLTFAQQLYSQDMLSNERKANYSKYMDKIKTFIPAGWMPGDLIETKLMNQQGINEDYLILIIIKSADLRAATPATGKILAIQKTSTDFIKKWESSENISAVDGEIGDMSGYRYPFDINRDGLTEIFVTFATAKIPTQGLVHLWIYSWDGTKGNLISSKSEVRQKGFSIFTGSHIQPPSIIDDDDDGIYEVFAQEKKIYKWNAQSKIYIYWKDEQFVN